MTHEPYENCQFRLCFRTSLRISSNFLSETKCMALIISKLCACSSSSRLNGEVFPWIKKDSGFNINEGLLFSPRCLLKVDGRQTISKIHAVFPNINPKIKNGINVVTPDKSLLHTFELLEAFDDEYEGAVIDPQCLPTSATAFESMLQSSLLHWQLKGKRGVWLKIPEHQADLVPIAIKEGFNYHHAEPGYVMLTYWIPSDEPCMLPTTGTHQLGIGGFVINDKREVLVVKEKKCPLRCSGLWKLPTGLVNKSEEICSSAVREVKEETGIDTSFCEVLAFRHAHNVTFEKSDLFFICMLQPLSFDIAIDESEIEAAKWIPLEEFIDQPFIQSDDFSRSIIELCVASYESRYHGFNARCVMSKFDDRVSYIYHGDLIMDSREGSASK